TVRDGAGRRIGSARVARVSTTRSRLVSVRLSRAIRRGHYRIGASFRSASGSRGTGSRTYTLG
ncbi:MAG: hypothetical protein JWM31_245, partial [Solirubrobacterales bacterium]|nr:hypothetical protein [Solirubrobacterales bacterium]